MGERTVGGEPGQATSLIQSMANCQRRHLKKVPFFLLSPPINVIFSGGQFFFDFSFFIP